MWKFDNVIFNVNGVGEEDLKKILCYVFDGHPCYGYSVNKKKGLILHCYPSSNNVTPFPSSLGAEYLIGIVMSWLKSSEAKEIPCEGFDANAEHDGDNILGWRVYTEEWGSVDGIHNCVAVKPAWLWYGK
jgi:hypothetical protein